MTPDATLRFCAYCPNPCRSAWPAQALQNEAATPSAMALLTIAVLDGRVSADADVRARLADRRMAETCRPACPYGFDIPALIAAATAYPAFRAAN